MKVSFRFMGSFVIAMLLGTAPLAVANPLSPPGAGRQPEVRAKAMLEKVVARIKEGDRQKAFREFIARQPPFLDRDLDVVCVDIHFVVVAHSGFPTYVGSGYFYKDADGALLAPPIWKAAAKGSGTFRFTLRDEETNHMTERKVGFFRRIKDDVCGVITRAL